MVKIIKQFSELIPFSFEEYCNLILSVAPKEDLLGITEIRFVERFSRGKKDDEAIAKYLREHKGKTASIEVNIFNLIKDKIPKYLFEDYPEIGALFLSEIICHEVGHHAHTFKRHGVKKNNQEIFADEYAKAGYFNYLKLRRSKILLSYKWAGLNIFMFKLKDCIDFWKNRKELVKWIKENNSGIVFP